MCDDEKTTLNPAYKYNICRKCAKNENIKLLIDDLAKCVELEKKSHEKHFTAELVILRLKEILNEK